MKLISNIIKKITPFDKKVSIVNNEINKKTLPIRFLANTFLSDSDKAKIFDKEITKRL